MIKSIQRIVSNIKFKIFFLFLIAFLPRIINLGGHDILADEISWMPRAKDVYAAVRTFSWSPYNVNWWLKTTSAEAIGLPITFLAGFSVQYLARGQMYSIHSLNLFQDFVAARVPAVLIGSFFIPVFYLLLRRLIKDKTAFVAAFLLALDPVAIALSRWLRQDIALGVFSVLALMLFFIEESGWIPIIASSFFTALTILTKPQGLLIVLTLVLFYLINILLRRKVDFKKLTVWLILSSVFTVLLFPYLWSNPVGNMLTYISIQTNNVVSGNLTFFKGIVTNNPPWYYYFIIFPFRLPESILVGFFVGLIIGLNGVRKKLVGNKFFLTSIIYSVLYVSFMSSYALKFGIRYLFPVWPYVYVLAAFGIICLEKMFKSKVSRIIYWILVVVFPTWGILEFSPVYYLYHNSLINPQRFQKLESVGQCDGVEPALRYLGPDMHQNIKIMLLGCDAAINYYTGYTIDKTHSVSDNPEYIIEEYQNGQMHPEIYEELKSAGYEEINQIIFRGIILVDIYKKPQKL